MNHLGSAANGLLAALRTRPTRQVTVCLLAVVASLAVLGLLAKALPDTPLGWWDLDSEGGGAAIVSALLSLLAAAALAVAVRRSPTTVWPGEAIAAVVAFMAADEVFEIHEYVQRSAGVDWVVVYAPALVAFGVAFLVLLRRWGLTSPQSTLLAAGAAAWVVAQLLEVVQWDGGVPRESIYLESMAVEEILEAAGSALFLLAAVVVLTQRRTRRAEPPASRSLAS